MPPTDWNGLQEGLVLHGFLDRDAIVEVHSQDDISPAIVDATHAAQNSTGDAVIVEEHIDFDRIEQLQPVGGALAGRFCGVPDRRFRDTPAHVRRARRPVFARDAERVDQRRRAQFRQRSAVAAPTNPVTVITRAFAQWRVASPFFALSYVAPGGAADIRVIFAGASADDRFATVGFALASAGHPQEGVT